MPLFSKNVEYLPPLKSSSWRKVAIGTWKTVGDPSVYGVLDLDVEPALRYIEKLKSQSSQKITITHFVGKAVALVFAKHPEINCVLRFGKLYPRKNVDLFFQVATDEGGKDLSGVVVRQADKKKIETFASEMKSSIERVRSKGDPDFKKMKSLMHQVPDLLVRYLIYLTGLMMYAFNIWTPLTGSPKDPFGSAMITSVGSLGLETAFAPLVPYSRVPLLLAVGAIHETPVVREGKIEIGKMVRLCVTFDHRLIDGIHASKMVKELKNLFANPELLS